MKTEGIVKTEVINYKSTITPFCICKLTHSIPSPHYTVCITFCEGAWSDESTTFNSEEDALNYFNARVISLKN